MADTYLMTQEDVKMYDNCVISYMETQTSDLEDFEFDRLEKDLIEAQLIEDINWEERYLVLKPLNVQSISEIDNIFAETPAKSMRAYRDIHETMEWVSINRNKRLSMTPKINGNNIRLLTKVGKLLGARTKGKNGVAYDVTTACIDCGQVGNWNGMVYVEGAILEQDIGTYSIAKSKALSIMRGACPESEKLKLYFFNSDKNMDMDEMFDLAKTEGFNVVPYALFEKGEITEENLIEYMELMFQWSEQEGVDTDGVVLSFNDVKDRKDISETARNNENNISLKFGPWKTIDLISKVTNITIDQVGLNGGCTIYIEPLTYNGANFSLVNGYNGGRLTRDNVRIGDRIQFGYTSKAIPVYMKKVVDCIE